MSNYITYQNLSSLVKENKDLYDFFSRPCNGDEYKIILTEAIKEEDYSVINALVANLPLNDWFDKETILSEFRNHLSSTFYKANNYAWCMAVPEIRAHFTAEEKGHFVHVGLALQNHEMAYHATLDHDWKRKLPENVLEQELKRLSGCSIKRLDGDHVRIDYFEWFSKEILPHFSKENQNLFLMGALFTSVGQLREIAELISLSEINFLKEIGQKENLVQVNQDLKSSINYLTDKLHFNYWTDEFKNKVFEDTIELPPSAVSRLIDIEKIRPLAKELETMVQYTKLEENLESKTDTNKKKAKI